MPSTARILEINSSRNAFDCESLSSIALVTATAPSNMNSLRIHARPKSNRASPLRRSLGFACNRARNTRSPSLACMASNTCCASTTTSCPFCIARFPPASSGKFPITCPLAGSSKSALFSSGTARNGRPCSSVPSAHSPRTVVLSFN